MPFRLTEGLIGMLDFRIEGKTCNGNKNDDVMMMVMIVVITMYHYYHMLVTDFLFYVYINICI